MYMLRPFNMASVVVESSQQSDSSLASKSTRPHAPMDVLPLSNPSGEKQNEFTVKCNHFSIRGYVSDVRKRDPKLCYPFSLKDSTDEPLSIELPPMVVPKFRWWQCVSCFPETSVSYDADNKEAHHKPEENADASLTLVGKSSKANVSGVRNAEASTSTDSNDNKNFPPLNGFVDLKGKGKAHVEDEPAPPSVLENGFLKDSSQGMLLQSTGEIEVSLVAGSEVVELGSRFSGDGVIQDLQKNSRAHRNEPRTAQEYVNQNGEYANENCREKPQVLSENRLIDSLANDLGAEVVGLTNGPSNDKKSHAVNLPDLNECSGEPMNDENKKAMVTNSNNDVFCEDDDDYLGAERRKNPKVRLLSELLGLKEIQISAKGKRKNLSITSSLDENAKRKKVGSQDEGSKYVDIRASNSGTKKITGSAEISKTDSEYASDSDDVSMEIISKALAKSWCKPKIPLPEKRHKKGKFDNVGSSISRQNIISRSVGHERGKTSEVLPQKNDVTDQLIERSSVLTKKRRKGLHSRKEAGAFIPCKDQIPKTSATTQKDADDEKSPPQKVQKESENVHHFPSSYTVKSQNLPSSQAESLLVDGSIVRKHQENRNNVGETNVDFRTIAVGLSLPGSPFDENGGRSIGLKTNLKEKEAGIPAAEEGGHLILDMRLQIVPSNKVRGRIHDIDINSIPVDDKPEQGAADDIPMDIVELMAKNQYERHLGDPKEKQNHPPPHGISRRYNRQDGTIGSLEECWQKVGQPHFLSMQKPPSTDARNCTANGSLGHLSDFNRNSLCVTSSLPRENPVSARFLSLYQAQEHSPPYPPCALSPNNWNGTINVAAAQRYPPNFLPTVESYGLRPCLPRQNTTDASLAWPPVVGNRMPLGITNPQMIAQSSNGLNKGKMLHPTSGSILNFNPPAVTSLGKQQNLNFSNPCSGGHPESSGGSVDTHTNDAISAMHLLSLMQNAAKMQSVALSLGTQKVARPTSSRQPYVENNRTSAVQGNCRHPCYPSAIPSARPFTPPFQNDGTSIARVNNTGFVGPIPLTLQGQRNMESSHFAPQGGDYRPSKRQMGSSQGKGKDISALSFPTFQSYVKPKQGRKDATPKFLCGGGVRREERTISPTPEKDFCALNKNPSEFNDHQVMFSYMIGPNDLRPWGKARERSARPKADSKRQVSRQRRPILPIPSGEESERQRKI